MAAPFHLAQLLLAVTLGYQAPRLITVVPPSSPWNVVIGNTVLATAQVNEVGTVRHVGVMQGVMPFTEEAVKAISQWKFEPSHLDGHAIPSEVSVLIMFRPHAFGNGWVRWTFFRVHSARSAQGGPSCIGVFHL